MEIVVDDIRLTLPEVQVTGPLLQSLKSGRYENQERALTRHVVRPGDRVLDLGAGLGTLSIIAAGLCGAGAVTSVEANPALIPAIRRSFEQNLVAGVRLIHGAVVPQDMDGQAVDLHLAPGFWGTSLLELERPDIQRIQVPGAGFTRLLNLSRASVVLMDLEGAEVTLFDDPLPAHVRALLIETHPAIYGRPTVEALRQALEADGFRVNKALSGRAVWLCERG